MNVDDAARLIADAVPRERGVWADLGAGEGTFTRALSELLEPGSRIYAVDRDAKALADVARWAKKAAADIVTVTADFSKPFDLPGLEGSALDGMLFANALHFVRDPAAVLSRLANGLRPRGRIVIVEYDRRGPNPWVPFPISIERLPEVIAAAGFSPPTVTATRSSAFGGDLYASYADLRLTTGAVP